MAKFCGPVGFVETIETAPGVWSNNDVERVYYGDVLRNMSRWSTSSETTNGELNINNQISIVADPYANENFHSMRYVGFMGTKWKITNVEVKYPRLILSLGGVYNG